MASVYHSLLCAGLALVLYSGLGLPLTLRLAPRPLALMLAPALGWAVHSVLALPLFFAIGLTRGTVLAAFALPLIVASAVLWRGRVWKGEAMLSRLSVLALAGAAVLAFVIMAAVLPKFSADGVTLAGPIFDHSKIAMIDEMTRLGVPPGNPFSSGGPAHLSYYYLWHFSAAELSALLGISGWEADAGMAMFSAFASLAVLIGLAVWLSGRAGAAVWVVALAATGSLRFFINLFTDRDSAAEFIGYQSGLGGWLFQTTWAPQHTAAATIALISIYLMVDFARRQQALTALVLALTMAAGFESSTWVGGFAFPIAAAPVALFLLLRIAPAQRLRFIIGLAIAAILAVLLMSPFLYDQLQMTALRGGGSPIAIEPTQVLDDGILDEYGAWLDWPAYWLIYLPVELPATYPAGLIALIVFLRDRRREHRTTIITLALTLAASLVTSWLLVSTLGENNDLGWRALLPGLMLLIVFAAAALSRLSIRQFSLPLLAAIIMLLLGGLETANLVPGNIVVKPLPVTSKAFAETPALWEAVRRVTPDAERVAISPDHMSPMTPWPANISWALLSNRRACYAGPAFAPFSALPKARQDATDELFNRVFDGRAEPGDVAEMAGPLQCATAVLTPVDNAWRNDPFAASPLYRLIDGTASWRIYRVVKP